MWSRCLLNLINFRCVEWECLECSCWMWWPWIWSRCLLINFHVLNANVIVECDRYPWMWSNLNSWILHHLSFHSILLLPTTRSTALDIQQLQHNMDVHLYSKMKEIFWIRMEWKIYIFHVLELLFMWIPVQGIKFRHFMSVVCTSNWNGSPASAKLKKG